MSGAARVPTPTSGLQCDDRLAARMLRSLGTAGGLILLSACAARAPLAEDERPLPVDDPEADEIVYLVRAPAEELLRVASDRLNGRYGPAFIDLARPGSNPPYWHLSTRYRRYRLNGRRYRSQCDAHCYPISQYPHYVYLSVRCKVDRHYIRSSFHGFPNWDWHREQGAYLAYDVINEIVHSAAIPENRLIRLRRTPSYEEGAKLIEAHEDEAPGSAAEPDEGKSDPRNPPVDHD